MISRIVSTYHRNSTALGYFLSFERCTIVTKYLMCEIVSRCITEINDKISLAGLTIAIHTNLPHDVQRSLFE